MKTLYEAFQEWVYKSYPSASSDERQELEAERLKHLVDAMNITDTTRGG